MASIIEKPNNSLAIERESYVRLHKAADVPNLIEVQLDSYRWFMEEGVKELLNDISPIRDFNANRYELEFLGYEFREPRYSEYECLQRDQNYSTPLYVKARLIIKSTGEIKEPVDLFFGDIPLMTAKGTFITSGTERVVVSQLLRSPGVYFTMINDTNTGRGLCHVSLIPSRGAWLEFETSNKDIIYVKIDGRRKTPVTTFLRAIGFGRDSDILSLFASEQGREHKYINATMEKDNAIRDEGRALIDIYSRMRPGDPPNIDNARKLITEMFFDPKHYDLRRVGRYKVNKRLGFETETNDKNYVLTRSDIVAIVRQMIELNNSQKEGDDIDHLGNRRIRTVGELVQNQFRIGLTRLERVAKERMSITGVDEVSPSGLINIRPVVSAIREFFGGSQLSQFMDQTNPLAELTHKRRLSAMGPGGLSRERAGFDVRDVHFSHYGRICPIETPEGPNIGLIGSLATYGRVNKYGFIETPYRKVYSSLSNNSERLRGETTREAVLDQHGKILVKAGTKITPSVFSKIVELPACSVPIVPFVSSENVYMTADEEDKFAIAQANARLDNSNHFIDKKVECRLKENYIYESPEKIQFMDVSSKQIFSVATALIPFLEHDDANRALMGANMQRQAVPVICPEAPIVATGIEAEAARYSGQVIFARNGGVVKVADSERIVVVRDDFKEDEYPLSKFVRTNQGTCINQRPVVFQKQKVVKGDILADSSATDKGELALGQNVICAFMSWEGYNYEDAIVLSDRLVQKDTFSSIHISKYDVEARDTKLGMEEITRDISNVGEESLRELDENGVIRIGAEVGPGDILVGKVTPKGETELSAEEKLLRAIFGEKAREVKDTSLRVPHGEWGKVINVKTFSRGEGDELPARVDKWVQVWVAQRRKISVGDKLAGRHGNKGIVSIVAPAADMPFLADGTPVDIILNPLGVPSRMNLGQILECHLGWASYKMGIKATTPVFDGATDTDIEDQLARTWFIKKAFEGRHNYEDTPLFDKMTEAAAWVEGRGESGERAMNRKYRGAASEIALRLWLKEHGVNSDGLSLEEMHTKSVDLSFALNIPTPILGKAILRDGKTGELFDQPVTVGNVYMLKLSHLVEDKVHARSTGPYSLISQQPLGGKAQFGGQRFGEMEVWTLEAYGAAHNLQEMLTIKSDDIVGRAKAYEAIVKGDDVLHPGVPESFKVLVKELQSLGLAIEVMNEEDNIYDGEIAVMEAPEIQVIGRNVEDLHVDAALAEEELISEDIDESGDLSSEGIIEEKILNDEIIEDEKGI